VGKYHGQANEHRHRQSTRRNEMNQHPKFQAFPLTRKPRRIDIIKEAALLVALVAVMGFIFYVGCAVGF